MGANVASTWMSGIAGFLKRNVYYMGTFYFAYQELSKVQPLVAIIGWAHNLVIDFERTRPIQSLPKNWG